MQTEKEYLVNREISSLRCESTGEYSLPDYNGDVKKVLAVKTKVFPSGKYALEDTLEFSGTVGYEVVYLDGENNVTHAKLSTDYEAAVKIDAESYVDSDVNTSVSSCNVRLVGPRKLLVKASLDNDVCILERRSYEIGGDAFLEYEPETLTDIARISSPCFAFGQGREISEEMASVEGAIVDEVEVLLSDAELRVDQIDMGEGVAVMKGDILLSVLLKNADQPPRLVSKSLPYSEELTFTDTEGVHSLEGRGEILGLKSSVTPTEDGVSVSLSFSLSPKVRGKKDQTLCLVSDAYLKERATENEYTDFNYTEHLCSETEENSFDERVPISELGIDALGEVIYAEAQPRVEMCEITDNGVKIQGEIRFSGIACRVCEGDEPSYSPVRFVMPFKHNVNLSCQKHDNMHAHCAVNANDVKISLDENNVHASCTLSYYVTVNTERRSRCLGASYLCEEEYSRDDSVVTVYYPDTSESLFSIAKRFHTSVSSIAECNRLTESVFASVGHPLGSLGVKKLIVK